MAEDKATTVDMDLVERIYEVTAAFQQTQDWGRDQFIVSWPSRINVSNFEKYIKPWLTRSVDDIHLAKHDFFVEERMKKNRTIEKIEALPEPQSSAEWFRWVTEECGVHRKGFFPLKVQFYQWAISQMMTVFAELAKLVQPELYQQVLYAFTGKREQRQ